MLLENGCWADIRTDPLLKRSKPCLFLDRDGVLVEDLGYLSKIEDIQFISGSAAAITRANELGWYCGIVTNQSGIGRGYYTWEDFNAVQSSITQSLEQQGCVIDFILACPHHPDAERSEYQVKNHPWRKPNPGMIKHVLETFDINRNASILVGDKVSDIKAAEAAGLGSAVHVLSGQGQSYANEARAIANTAFAVSQINSIAELQLTNSS